MLSKKKLFEALDELHATDAYSKLGLKHHGISNETFGRKSCIYIHTESNGNKKVLERELEMDGFKVNPKYAPNSQTVEVQVSYFKGWHWDE